MTKPSAYSLTDDQVTTIEHTLRANPQPSKPTKQEPTKRLTFNVPASLHRRFKGACIDHDLSMVGEAIALIERRTAELEGK
jgi:hypothetical protein